jgi:transcriptional regulator with XRE-family HTH domain
MSDDPGHRAFLLRVLATTGLTQTQLAHRAGLDPSTLSRFLTEGREGHTLRASTLRKIEQATGVPLDETAGVPNHGFAESEAAPLVVDTASPLQRIVAILAASGANIDPWTLHSPALEGAGYRRGDILLVSLGETPASGDIVCAQIYDWAKGRAETVFRMFQPPYLVAATSDPAFLRPHLVEDGKVVIKGVVVHSIRSRS